MNYHPNLEHMIHRHSNVTTNNITASWAQLNEKERDYAYYMSEASYAGSKMVFNEISYESPLIFLVMQAYF